MSTAPPPHPLPATGEPPVKRPEADRSGWRLWMAPAAIVMGFSLGLVGTAVVGVAAVAAGTSLTHPTPAVSLIEDLVFDVSFVAAALYFAGLNTPRRARDFGFRRVPLWTAIKGIAAAGVSYYIVTDLYASLVHLHGSDKLPTELGVSKSTAALVGAALFVCVIAPIAEEFFFRGFIFGVLRRWRIVVAGRDVGTVLAAIITGILFGLAHTGSASPQYLIPLGFLGFVLCLLRWKTGSLYPCMALHSLNNSLALGYNQLHWNALEILGLIAAAIATIWLLVGRLAAPEPTPESTREPSAVS